MVKTISHLYPIPHSIEKDGIDWKAFGQALLNSWPNCAFATDDSGTIVISNKMTQEHFGLFPGTKVENAMPDFWTLLKNTLHDYMHHSSVSIRSEKASFLARISRILWYGSPVGLLFLLEDRTELAKMTHKMLAYQQLSRDLDAIINSTNDGLWICDANAQVIRINPASERINKVRAEEMVGRNMRDLVEEGFVNISATLEVIKTGKKVSLFQTTRDGTKLILTGNPTFGPSGQLTQVVVNEQDITEIDNLRRELEIQETQKEQLQHQMLEMQLADLESTRIIARSPAITKVLQQAIKVAQVDSTVLILGESGVGKELIADLIHKYSGRSGRLLNKINCGAIPETLVESELFGYEKGAFTGARAGGKPGQLELSDRGILFLDEIGELPLSMQVKLLRFLEDGRVTRVGGASPRQLDVRILAATNRNLAEMASEGKFRQDLYYRLHVIPIRMPPLRERRDCILPLIHHYVEHFCKKHKIERKIRFTSRALEALSIYPYPGNVRELVNLCERLVVMAEVHRIDLEDLPMAVTQEKTIDSSRPLDWDGCTSLQDWLDDVEKRVLVQAMETHRTQTAVAAILGVNQSTITRKLKKHGLTGIISW